MNWINITHGMYPTIISKNNRYCSIPERWKVPVFILLDALSMLDGIVEVMQIKEKFGDLRVYTNVQEKNYLKVNSLVFEAQQACSKICAECGSDEDVVHHSSEKKHWCLPRCAECRD